MTESSFELPAGAPRFESPWDRVVGATRAFARALVRADGDTAESLGERHVHLGLRIAALGVAAVFAGSLFSSAGWSLSFLTTALGALAGSFLIGAGVLASSRIARALMLLQGLGYVIAAAQIIAALPRFGSATAATAAAVMAASMLTFTAGAALANLTPAARAWHRDRVRAKRARKAKTLADWRRAEERGGR
jgi:hypothetical protein